MQAGFWQVGSKNKQLNEIIIMFLCCYLPFFGFGGFQKWFSDFETGGGKRGAK